jgi:hypothetical protein
MVLTLINVKQHKTREPPKGWECAKLSFATAARHWPLIKLHRGVSCADSRINYANNRTISIAVGRRDNSPYFFTRQNTHYMQTFNYRCSLFFFFLNSPRGFGLWLAHWCGMQTRLDRLISKRGGEYFYFFVICTIIS